MNKQRLFKDSGEFTEKALEIDSEVNKAISSILQKYAPSYDMRDLMLVVNQAANEPCLLMAVDAAFQKRPSANDKAGSGI